MHKSWTGHLAYSLPFIADYVISFNCVQRDIVKTTEHVNLLRLEKRYCWMGASRLLHLCYIAPFFVPFIKSLNRVHIQTTIKTTNRIDAVSQNSSGESTSCLIHSRYHLPFLYFWIINLHWFEWLTVYPSKASNCVYFIATDHDS